ncbi:RNA polymerase sigma-70 factor (ECF subfamily) [Catenuloplanes nepalensis]|uniref:RNA polymerase sigma-70 factor (ECF subfamily) n=1 Tax=Catenuloplanes nepalensis TaxID=587533 RepID=A0ABT9N5F2_9ACTN|nr:RNA polymerase sigma factor [Catenuloplanes nepalensis]MDP9798913.1 RNA polymerase sigma-70 factor (ECF subfamily) [Catenuloplanes nepalensis]
MASAEASSAWDSGATPNAPESPEPQAGRFEDHLSPADQAAFEQFFIEYFRALMKMLIWAGASRHEAEDAIQESMLVAYRNWSDIKHPEAWVRRVALRQFARTRQRSQELAPRLLAGGWLPEERENKALEPAAVVAERHLDHGALEALKRLPPRQRQIMALVMDDFSTMEIAEILSMDTSAVRSNLYKARQTLRNQMKQGELFDP